MCRFGARDLGEAKPFLSAAQSASATAAQQATQGARSRQPLHGLKEFGIGLPHRTSRIRLGMSVKCAAKPNLLLDVATPVSPGVAPLARRSGCLLRPCIA